MAPQSVFGIANAFSELSNTPNSAMNIASRVPAMVVWLWLNLLVFNLANQRCTGSVVEDTINRPWRPIPSGRITPAETQVALFVAAPCVLLATAIWLGHRVVLPNLAVLLMTWLYNDVGAANAGPIWRNLINALGIASFGWGATASLLSGVNDLGKAQVPYLWLALTAAVTFTTVQSQDLPDMKGDAARNRLTMPLRYGELATRISIAFFALFWSIICPAYLHVTHQIVQCMPLIVGIGMAFLVITYWNEASDKAVWTLWCVWVAALYLLPLDRG